MNAQEKQLAVRIAGLMRAARKRRGLSQMTIAERLGISQANLSKIEAAKLVPSAPQWFAFSEYVGIAPDSLTIGYLDQNSPAQLLQLDSELGFKVPKKYLDNRGSKIRALLPFLIYSQNELGEQRFNEYLKSVGIDPDLFIIVDEQINLNFLLDLSQMLIQKGHLKPKDLTRLADVVLQPEAHGGLNRTYLGNRNAKQLLNLLLLNARLYECNFRYEIEDETSTELTFSVKPEKHLSAMKYKDDDVLGDFLCRYKKNYFERFSQFGGGPKAVLRETQCHYRGADRCLYKIKTAA